MLIGAWCLMNVLHWEIYIRETTNWKSSESVHASEALYIQTELQKGRKIFSGPTLAHVSMERS